MNSKGKKSTSKRRRVSENTAAPSPQLSTSKQPVVFSLEMILYMANFMCFQDYKRFVQSFYPDNVVNDLIRKKLWELSTYRTEAKFINGKPMVIEYNFDPSRPKEHHILMNVKSLSPIFGGIVSETMKEFTGVPELTDFIDVHVHLNQCSRRQFASCPCHLVNSKSQDFEAFRNRPTEACMYRHDHHYCSHHVASWLNILEDALLLRRRDHHCVKQNLARSSTRTADDTVYLPVVTIERYGSILK